jgi:hypothetical protein
VAERPFNRTSLPWAFAMPKRKPKPDGAVAALAIGGDGNVLRAWRLDGQESVEISIKKKADGPPRAIGL